MRRSGVVFGEFWTGGYFVLARAAPAAISGVLSCLFVHYPCIIRQTIIPLCFASVVQMLTGNESPQAGGRVGVTISQLFIACPTGIKVSRLKSPFAEREKAFFSCRLSGGDGKYRRFMRTFLEQKHLDPSRPPKPV